MRGVVGSPVHLLYTEYILGGGRGDVAEELWGRIPATMWEAYGLLGEVKGRYGPPPGELGELKEAIRADMERLGVLTSKASARIDRLGEGAIETGQQPYALGGSSLILNKIAYIESLSGLGREGYVPLFFVADYDGVQSELLNTRVPSPSQSGLLFSYPVGPGYEGSPIYEVPNPPEGWLEGALESLRGNYRGLLRHADQATMERALLNLDHAITILKGAYYSTDNVSDWSTKTLGTLVNLEAGLGVPILPFSMPRSRRLFQGGYEFLLSEPSRGRFIEASNRAAELVEASGYRAGIGFRDDDYVPFFLECSTEGCHRTRVEVKYRRGRGSPTASVRGECPKCGEVYDFSFDAGSPDLTEVVGELSPKVDSRQVVVDSVVPVLAHIGGPGETSYYAEVIPAARSLDIPFPVFARYTRLFYNTPWNEAYAEALSEEGYPVLHEDRLFNAIGDWVEARNEGDRQALIGAHGEIRAVVRGVDCALRSELESLELEIDAIKGKLREPEGREARIREMRERQSLAHEVERYLSSALGRFSPERFGQEVSWAWIDVATVAGVGDLLGVFMRQYNENTPNSSMFFANL